jgi:hypothetical protein
VVVLGTESVGRLIAGTNGTPSGSVISRITWASLRVRLSARGASGPAGGENGLAGVSLSAVETDGESADAGPTTLEAGVGSGAAPGTGPIPACGSPDTSHGGRVHGCSMAVETVT